VVGTSSTVKKGAVHGSMGFDHVNCNTEKGGFVSFSVCGKRTVGGGFGILSGSKGGTQYGSWLWTRGDQPKGFVGEG